MARWATFAEIAGVSFTGCRVKLVDEQQFQTAYQGSVDWANDGSADVQTLNRGVKGITFGVNIHRAEQDDLEDLLTAIQLAESTGTTFVVNVIDGMYNVNVNCVPDYSQRYLSHGEYSEGWYEDVVLRFVVISGV